MKKIYILLTIITIFNKQILGELDPQFLIKHVKQSIEKAKLGQSRLNHEILNIEGMSSSKVRHFLNNICSMPQTSYFEIGVWGESTFISSLFNNSNVIEQAIAIDNWSQFGGPAEMFRNNVDTFLSQNIFKFYDIDCFQVNKTIFKKLVNVYFYDGDHRAEDQYNAFVYYNDIFEDTFIAIVDDWNHPPVKEGTRAAFKKLNYTVLFEQELPARYNADKENWWNGLYVAVISKPVDEI